MKELFSQFRIEQILLMVIVIALAAKELITFIDWSKKRTRQAIEQKDKPVERLEAQESEITELKEEIHHINKQIDLLVKSDIDTLRHSLTKDHHYFCYKLKCIDDFSLQCMEKEYENYKKQGGNSFVDELMVQIRALPRRLEKDNR